jgi:amino acid transporter
MITRRAMPLSSLCAATFFIVSGGPYGLEEVVLGHGYAGALALLVAVPLVWSLPVALLVGELGAAIPETGGYCVWVRRGLGRFWGLQESWLSAAVGIVDIAIYPTLLAAYAGRFVPALARDAPLAPGWWLGVAVIAACAGWNARGVRSVGRGEIGLGAILLAPFAVLCALAVVRGPPGAVGAALSAPRPADGGGLVAGLLLCMWNYMGWDNAATFAAEVERPQRSYPRAMAATVGLVALTYVLATLAAAASGLPASSFTTGAWVDAGASLGGPALAAAIAAGGIASAVGMYNALLLSWSRLPVALALDGWLPATLARRHPSTGAPVPAVLLGAALSALCVGLGLRRLVVLDVVLYGAALLLEFAALVALRIREPDLPRPCRVPGGIAGAVAIALPPAALLAAAVWAAREEPGALGLSGVALAGLVACVGPAWWLAAGRGR